MTDQDPEQHEGRGQERSRSRVRGNDLRTHERRQPKMAPSLSTQLTNKGEPPCTRCQASKRSATKPACGPTCSKLPGTRSASSTPETTTARSTANGRSGRRVAKESRSRRSTSTAAAPAGTATTNCG